MALLIVLALLAVIPGAVARARGRSFVAWWLYGCILLPVALVHVLIASRIAPAPLQPIRFPTVTTHPVTRAAPMIVGATPQAPRITAARVPAVAKQPGKQGVTLAPGEILLGQNLNRLIMIDYADARTNKSRRQILVHKAIGAYGPDGIDLTRLYATCSVRKAMRTFRVDRIQQAADPETGEVITDLRQFLLG